MSRCLVTGATGFAGSHLVDYLLAEGHEVIAARRHRSSLNNLVHLIDNYSHVEALMEGNFKLVEMDIEDLKSWLLILKEWAPDKIFHLAAQTFVPTSWKAPGSVLRTNAFGTLNMLDAVHQMDQDLQLRYC